jgi:hypothetical protein
MGTPVYGYAISSQNEGGKWDKPTPRFIEKIRYSSSLTENSSLRVEKGAGDDRKIIRLDDCGK